MKYRVNYGGIKIGDMTGPIQEDVECTSVELTDKLFICYNEMKRPVAIFNVDEIISATEQMNGV